MSEFDKILEGVRECARNNAERILSNGEQSSVVHTGFQKCIRAKYSAEDKEAFLKESEDSAIENLKRHLLSVALSEPW